jgi:alpha/beta superfamily hydrolase
MPDIIINGPEGRLECRYQNGREPNAPIALMLHPHPRHGGTMNNKIVYTLYHIFAKRGFACLRFNFRGVGRSQGSFARGEGELSDAAAALDWLQAYNENASQCWIAGFSFGAWIGMQLLMRRPEITSFISIAPPANMYDFSFLAPCPSSGLFISGEKDEIVPHDSIETLVNKLRQQRGIDIDLRNIPKANHFFHKKLTALEKEVGDYLDAAMAAKTAEDEEAAASG